MTSETLSQWSARASEHQMKMLDSERGSRPAENHPQRPSDVFPERKGDSGKPLGNPPNSA
jgi:hypothetical protein